MLRAIYKQSHLGQKLNIPELALLFYNLCVHFELTFTKNILSVIKMLNLIASATPLVD